MCRWEWELRLQRCLHVWVTTAPFSSEASSYSVGDQAKWFSLALAWCLQGLLGHLREEKMRWELRRCQLFSSPLLWYKPETCLPDCSGFSSVWWGSSPVLSSPSLCHPSGWAVSMLPQNLTPPFSCQQCSLCNALVLWFSTAIPALTHSLAVSSCAAFTCSSLLHSDAVEIVEFGTHSWHESAVSEWTPPHAALSVVIPSSSCWGGMWVVTWMTVQDFLRVVAALFKPHCQGRGQGLWLKSRYTLF